MEGVIGVVTCFAGPAIPKYWLPCNGQQLQISAYPVLFDIIGNAFGGDGKTTFNLPDLRGRIPVSPGNNGSGNQYKSGVAAGSETILLTGGELPAHTHTGQVTVNMEANSSDGVDASSNLGFPSRFTGAYSPTANCAMALTQTYFEAESPGAQPVNICTPYLVVNYIICYAGIFPSKG